MTTTITVSRERLYQAPLRTGRGPAWKWTYYLPKRQVTTPDGRNVVVQPGGFTSKVEIVNLARNLYSERPLVLAFPDGTTKQVKR